MSITTRAEQEKTKKTCLDILSCAQSLKQGGIPGMRLMAEKRASRSQKHLALVMSFERFLAVKSVQKVPRKKLPRKGIRFFATIS